MLSLIGIGALLAMALAFRKELAAAATALLNLIHSMVPPIPSAANESEVLDVVDVSAFAPEAARGGEQVLVQVYFHLVDQTTLASQLAREADAETKRRGVVTLMTEIARGQRVDVILDVPDLNIKLPPQQIVWRGHPRACPFLLDFPPVAGGHTYAVRVRIVLDTVPIGHLVFKIRVLTADQPIDRTSTIQGERARRYRQAFLSYASPDRAEVLKRAQALRAARINFFHDLLTLEPGQRWEQRLYEEIERCDLFLLFWSSQAARSEWVIREAEYALAHQKKTAPDETPEITPIILEGPPIPLPPESLKHIHFNDALRYVIAAVEQEIRPKPSNEGP